MVDGGCTELLGGDRGRKGDVCFSSSSLTSPELDELIDIPRLSMHRLSASLSPPVAQPLPSQHSCSNNPRNGRKERAEPPTWTLTSRAHRHPPPRSATSSTKKQGRRASCGHTGQR